jgi:hypothetical protein
VALKSKKKMPQVIGVVTLLVFSGFASFLTHLRSYSIWSSLPLISFVQFPWRFLGLTIFFLSFAIGGLAMVDIRLKKPLFLLVILLTVVINLGYFRPQYVFLEETDSEKLSGESFVIQQKSAILDYLPKTAPMAPKELASENPEIISGKGQAYNFTKRSNSFFFDTEIYQDAVIQIPVMYFPGWKVISEGVVIDSNPSGDYGVITITVPEGKHIIQGRFVNTPVRNIGNLVTILSAVIMFSGVVLKANNKKLLWM